MDHIFLREGIPILDKKKKKGKKEKFLFQEDGQILIEFFFAFILSLSLFILFVNFALSISAGYLVHYATYMSSRTLLVVDRGNNAGASDAFAQAEATKVFNSFNLERFGIVNTGVKFNLPGSVEKHAFLGAYYEFTKNISYLMFIGRSTNTKLISESYLGREPLRVECLQSIQEKTAFIAPGIDEKNQTLFDNGC